MVAGLRAIAAGLPSVARASRYGFGRIFWLFKSGFWVYPGIFWYVFLPNKDAFVGIVTSPGFSSVKNLLTVFGSSLAAADATIAENVYDIVMYEATGLDYLALLVGAVGALATILWAIRAGARACVFASGNNVPQWSLYFVPAAFYAMLVWKVRGDLPFEGVMLFVENAGAVFDLSRIFAPVVELLAGVPFSPLESPEVNTTANLSKPVSGQ